MIPTFLVPEQTVCEDGEGAATSLGSLQGKSVLVTLGITRIIEQESLDISILGSADGETWELITAFPQKFYCGTYSMVLDLANHPACRKIKAQWQMGRWGRGEQRPLFGFYLFVQEASSSVAGGA